MTLNSFSIENEHFLPLVQDLILQDLKINMYFKLSKKNFALTSSLQIDLRIYSRRGGGRGNIETDVINKRSLTHT